MRISDKRRMLPYLLALIFAAANGFSAEQPSLRTQLRKVLPVSVQTLKPGQTTRAEVAKLFGDPLKGSTQKEQFYQTTKTGAGAPDTPDTPDSNDLTVQFDSNDRVQSYYYLFPTTSKAPSFSSLKSFFTSEELKQTKRNQEDSAGKHEAGRDFGVISLRNGLFLKFSQKEDPELSSVYSWKPGEKMP